MLSGLPHQCQIQWQLTVPSYCDILNGYKIEIKCFGFTVSPLFHLELCFLWPVCEDKVHPDLYTNIYSLDVWISAWVPGCLCTVHSHLWACLWVSAGLRASQTVVCNLTGSSLRDAWTGVITMWELRGWWVLMQPLQMTLSLEFQSSASHEGISFYFILHPDRLWFVTMPRPPNRCSLLSNMRRALNFHVLFLENAYEKKIMAAESVVCWSTWCCLAAHLLPLLIH